MCWAVNNSALRGGSPIKVLTLWVVEGSVDLPPLLQNPQLSVSLASVNICSQVSIDIQCSAERSCLLNIYLFHIFTNAIQLLWSIKVENVSSIICWKQNIAQKSEIFLNYKWPILMEAFITWLLSITLGCGLKGITKPWTSLSLGEECTRFI